MRALRLCGVAALVVALAPVGAAGAAVRTPSPTQETVTRAQGPLRMAFYYPWFPEGWGHGDVEPYTHFTPSLGFYDTGDRSIVRAHVDAMRWGRIRAATYSWWGQGSSTDQRFRTYLSVGERRRFRWAVYHELEGYGDPSAAEIRSDLEYIRDRYATSRAYLRVDGRFVVFVYGDADDGPGCDVANRWHEAAEGVGAYVVLRAFRGFQLCASQPDGWHSYKAERHQHDLSPYSFTVSPGFFFAPEGAPRTPRNLSLWRRSVRHMIRSHAQFQLVLSFNEWGEGTAVESAVEWASPSGYGRYLDVLHEIR